MSTQQIIVFGIQAALRAAQAGADIYKRHARDRPIFLPDVELPGLSRSGELLSFLMANPGLAASEPELEAIWDAAHEELTTTAPVLIDSACAVMLRHRARQELLRQGLDEGSANREAELLAAGRMVEQWRDERKPPSPLIRLALTITDIGLEYVSSDPSILGVGSRGEKLIVAFANNMSALIPNEVQAFGSKTDFADRVLGIFLRAGLGALSSNASAAFSNEDLATLITGVTKPIIEALPGDITEQMNYRSLVDSLAGPAADAAFSLLGENTHSYLGKHFGNDKALGAVTSALFNEISGLHTTQTFSEQGITRLYKAVLGVAVDRPQLFLDMAESSQKTLFKELLVDAASTLREDSRLRGPIWSSFAAMAVTTIGRNAPALLNLNPGEPWQAVAQTALEQITEGMSDSLSSGAFQGFDDEQLLEFGRIVLVQVATTPGMLSIDRTEVQAVVSGIAQAMAADDNLLLSADQWLHIASTAVKVAAANPGRLFGVTIDEADVALATTVIKQVLAAAADTWGAAGRNGQALLFGETLAAALVTAIDALAGNVSALVANPGILEELLIQILDDAATNPDEYGSDGLLRVLRAALPHIMAAGTLPSPKQIEHNLSA